MNWMKQELTLVLSRSSSAANQSDNNLQLAREWVWPLWIVVSTTLLIAKEESEKIMMLLHSFSDFTALLIAQQIAKRIQSLPLLMVKIALMHATALTVARIIQQTHESVYSGTTTLIETGSSWSISRCVNIFVLAEPHLQKILQYDLSSQKE